MKVRERDVTVKWNKKFYDKYKDIFHIKVSSYARRFDFLDMEGYTIRDKYLVVYNKEWINHIRYDLSTIMMTVPESCLDIFSDLVKI